MSNQNTSAPFTRLDDYGLVTYLSMIGYEVQVQKGAFEVRIDPNVLKKEISAYKASPHKKFDTTGKHLKKMLKASNLVPKNNDFDAHFFREMMGSELSQTDISHTGHS